MEKYNILIIRLSSFGDVLLTTPLLRAIKRKYKSSIIHFLTRKNNIQIFQNNPLVDKIIIYENELHNQIKETLKSQIYDIVIDLQNNLRSNSLLRYVKSRKIKYPKNNLRKFLLVKFKINLLKNRNLNVAEKYIKTVDGLEPDNQSLEYFPTIVINREIKTKKRVGICPASKHFTKSWPKEYYIELSKKLIATGYEVVVLGGKDDEIIAQDIMMIVNDVRNGITKDNDLDYLFSQMLNCDLIVCNDSGLMHFACTIPNKNIITIFGSTVKDFGFTPYNNPNAEIIEISDLKCRPCTHIGKEKCPKKHFKCMLDIKPDIVFKKIEEKINVNNLENNL